jgi:poly(ADP-ribose) glycohydrolase ARH3
MATLNDKFRGCLVGAALGDIAGAAVEAESPEYIASAYRSIDDILSKGSVPELAGPPWEIGRFTDDTQMTVCVADWLLHDDSHSAERLLAKLAEAYEPWRRYGAGTAAILRMFPLHKTEWRQLSTSMFPHGSYGNGSATRVAPVGLAFHANVEKAASVAIESSRSTHSHSLAFQAAVLQSIAVATAVASTEFSVGAFLTPMRAALGHFSDLLQNTSPFARALDIIERGLELGSTTKEVSSIIGTGVDAHESYAQVIHDAVFIGGDTDTIACMAGAISGAFIGRNAIPTQWVNAVREERYSVSAIEKLADQLLAKYVGQGSQNPA